MTTTKDEVMREAGLILRHIFDSVIQTLRPGVNLDDIDNFVGNMLRSAGARSALKMMGFPSNMSFAVDEQVMQATPSGRLVRCGDIISIDMTIYYEGLFVDKATTLVVEPAHYIKRYLANAVKSCLTSAVKGVRPGMRCSEVGHIIESQAKVLRMRVGKEFYGHTIGESHHMKPLIPNFNDMSESIIRKGHYIAIEPIIFYDTYFLTRSKFEVKSNVLSAHAEDTIYVGSQGAEVIT